MPVQQYVRARVRTRDGRARLFRQHVSGHSDSGGGFSHSRSPAWWALERAGEQ